MRFDRNAIAIVVMGAVLLALGPVLPSWAVSLLNVALCYGTVVLGMMLLMRTGIVSFGHGLYYCLGAYAAGLLDHFGTVPDMLLMVGAGALGPGLVALVLVPLLA